MGKYYQQTITRTIVGGVILIISVAFVLIWIIYGREAAFTGFSCMLSGLLPIISVFLVFIFMDYVIKKYRQAEERQGDLPSLGNGEQTDKDTDGTQG